MDSVWSSCSCQRTREWIPLQLSTSPSFKIRGGKWPQITSCHGINDNDDDSWSYALIQTPRPNNFKFHWRFRNSRMGNDLVIGMDDLSEQTRKFWKKKIYHLAIHASSCIVLQKENTFLQLVSHCPVKRNKFLKLLDSIVTENWRSGSSFPSMAVIFYFQPVLVIKEEDCGRNQVLTGALQGTNNYSSIFSDGSNVQDPLELCKARGLPERIPVHRDSRKFRLHLVMIERLLFGFWWIECDKTVFPPLRCQS